MGDNAYLPSVSNISKTVVLNIAFVTGTFFKEHLTSFLMISRLTDFAFVVLWLLIFKVCGITGISKTEFFIFSGTGRVNIMGD